MSFTIDASIGGSASNSYITLSAAEDVVDGKLKTERWDEADTSTKNAALGQATLLIDAESFGGEKAAKTQQLQFPRNYVYDRDGNVISSTIIPNKLEHATIELALYLLQEDDRTASKDEIDDLESFKVGPLQYNIRKTRNSAQLPMSVINLLKAIGSNAWTSGAATEMRR